MQFLLNSLMATLVSWPIIAVEEISCLLSPNFEIGCLPLDSALPLCSMHPLLG